MRCDWIGLLGELAMLLEAGPGFKSRRLGAMGADAGVTYYRAGEVPLPAKVPPNPAKARDSGVQELVLLRKWMMDLIFGANRQWHEGPRVR